MRLCFPGSCCMMEKEKEEKEGAAYEENCDVRRGGRDIGIFFRADGKAV